MRDYHSPNIIWRDEKTGNERIGLIDFQDAMIGPQVYDLVSLAQDARVEVPTELEQQIVAAYVEQRQLEDQAFDKDRFHYEYALMGAQRASKLLGIFVRLDLRDHKPEYRRHLASVRTSLKRNLRHDGLVDYRRWCERVIGI